MMNWSDIPFAPPSRTLRQFAGLWMAFFGGLAGQAWHQGRPESAGLFALVALTVGPLGLWQPQLLRPIFVGALVLTFPIGWLVSRLVLAVLFYTVFTPVGLLFRLAQRDALGLKTGGDAVSYWSVKPQVSEATRYFRQF
jgi:hypothetical protein